MHFGLRIWKSVLGVFLCGLIDLLRGQAGTPFYSCIALLQCMRQDKEDSLKFSLQREMGTLIGAFYGVFMILWFNDVEGLLRYTIISLAIIPIINTAILIRHKNAAYFACVVFLSIAINHLGDRNPYLFVFNRWLDTTIGIVLAYMINQFSLPHNYDTKTIFVMPLTSSLDGYSKYHLQRLLTKGVKITFDFKGDIDQAHQTLDHYPLTLPIICDDGHTLYDLKKHQFIINTSMEPSLAQAIYRKIVHLNPHIAYIKEQTLMIGLTFDDEFYFERRHSPYLNYFHQELPVEQAVLYFECTDITDSVLQLEGVEVVDLGNHRYKIYAPNKKAELLTGTLFIGGENQKMMISEIERLSKRKK